VKYIFFSAFFLSWILVRQKQPSNFRTDLIVVTPEENLEKLAELSCAINARSDRQVIRMFGKSKFYLIKTFDINRIQQNKCVIHLYTPLVMRQIPKSMAPDPLLDYSGHIDSMLSLAEYNGYNYDALLRSDLDAFLLPGFASWTTSVQGRDSPIFNKFS
jgi:hypothetical protein